MGVEILVHQSGIRSDAHGQRAEFGDQIGFGHRLAIDHEHLVRHHRATVDQADVEPLCQRQDVGMVGVHQMRAILDIESCFRKSV